MMVAHLNVPPLCFTAAEKLHLLAQRAVIWNHTRWYQNWQYLNIPNMKVILLWLEYSVTVWLALLHVQKKLADGFYFNIKYLTNE